MESDVTTIEGFHDLYTATSADIYRYLARRVGTHVAEDLVSEVYLVAWRRRDHLGLVVPGREVAWLTVVARNLLQHHGRASGRQGRALARLPRRPHTEGADVAVLARLAAASTSERLRRVMTPAEDRMLDHYLAADGSCAQVAAELGLPVGTVKSRMDRMRKRLARIQQGRNDE